MQQKNDFLECEKTWVYWLLIISSGIFGSYTVIQRGGVFCNAQTANIVLFGIALGQQDWSKAGYLLIPITAYLTGSFVSEYLGKTVKRFHFLRWDTILIGIEVIAVFILGLLPAKVPDQISQVVLNFICSMQFNTFRQVEGIPAATTFVTNHIREVSSNLAKFIRHHDADSGQRVRIHGLMILFFVLGAGLGTVCCTFLGYRAIWISGVILLVVFIRLAYADRSYEKSQLDKVPHGH